MKNLIILLALLISTTATAKPKIKKNRKVSNSNYYTCTIERDAVDKTVFKKEYFFPFPSEKNETYELKGSMRWNHFNLLFAKDGTVDIMISEVIKGETVVAKKTHQMEKESKHEGLNVQLDLKKDDVVVTYTVQCNPE